MKLVAPIVYHLRPHLPASIETQDLEATGLLGLVIAARTFEEGRAPFAYWARRLIRQTILSSVLEANRDPDGRAPGQRHARRLQHEYSDLRLTERTLQGVTPAAPAPADADLAAALTRLTIPERHLVGLVYEDGGSLRKLSRGGILGSRRSVIALHRKATQRLRQELERRRVA